MLMVDRRIPRVTPGGTTRRDHRCRREDARACAFNVAGHRRPRGCHLAGWSLPACRGLQDFAIALERSQSQRISRPASLVSPHGRFDGAASGPAHQTAFCRDHKSEVASGAAPGCVRHTGAGAAGDRPDGTGLGRDSGGAFLSQPVADELRDVSIQISLPGAHTKKEVSCHRINK